MRATKASFARYTRAMMSTTVRSTLLLVALVGCDASTTPPASDAAAAAADAAAMFPDAAVSSDAAVDAAAVDAAAFADAGAPGSDAGAASDCDLPERTVAAGDVSGAWCGAVHVTGAVRVPAGGMLSVAPGTRVDFAPAVALTVEGTLVLGGQPAGHIALGPASGRWSGLVVRGVLEASFTDVSQADVGLTTAAAGSARFVDGSVRDCGSPAAVEGDTTFDRSSLVGGTTVRIAGTAAALRMTDTTLDLLSPIGGPDCTSFSGGTTVLDHVRITGCHCPLHFNATSAPITVTNSILDGATNPVMIANTSGAFHGNVFDGVGNGILDIGGGIDVDVADNDWTQPTADIGSRDLSQFRNASSTLASRPAGVGPRP